jgi:hypothetical protein
MQQRCNLQGRGMCWQSLVGSTRMAAGKGDQRNECPEPILLQLLEMKLQTEHRLGAPFALKGWADPSGEGLAC